jgi:hypothetical protein
MAPLILTHMPNGMQHTSFNYIQEIPAPPLVNVGSTQKGKGSRQQKQAEKADQDDRKIQWELAIEGWEKKRADFRKAGLPMNRAGKKPCLKDVKADEAEDDSGTALEEDIQAPGALIRPQCAIRLCQILDSSEEELSDNLDYDNLDSD